jgi:hypothetical protein
VIDTVNDLDNVLYEISNESTGTSNNTTWQYHMINYIKSYESGKPNQHPVGMTKQWPNASNSVLFSSPADWISPEGDISNPSVANGSKVILSDTDHLCGICGDRQWVWKSFTHGENPLFMDPYDGQATGRGAPAGYDPNNPNDVSLRENLGYALDYAERINLTGMIPTASSSACSTTYCLRNTTTNQYLVYLPSATNVTVNLSTAPSNQSLNYEWFNPSTGTVTSTGMVQGGSIQPFSPPSGGDWVLYIYDATP